MKILLLVLFACILGAESARGKQPKAVKQLIALCDAVNANTLSVKDPAYDDVFSDIDEFCDDMFDALGREPSGKNRSVDGVRVITKVCKWFNRKYDEEPTEGPLVGLGEVCNATAEAKSLSLTDKGSRKALGKLNGLCVAEQNGSVEVRISNFTEVFADLGDFCDAYLNETAIEMESEGEMVNGIKSLGYVCTWYTKKFAEEPAEGALGGLTELCANFDEVVESLQDDGDKEEEEEDK